MELRCSGGRSDFRMVALAITWENGNVMLCVQIKKLVLDFVKLFNKETKYKVKSIVLVKKYG
ncbi:MAG: hypothetical protein CEE42_05210 [Promethearchaeota archaeon Loki_b31]|nr:MAG: hypothetical protein CEE42_05210 [Candidatus Lokiarchaeota archaeon Loki_b31]